MKRYVEANALYASIAKDTYLLTDENDKRDYGMYLIGIKKKIDEAPTASVVEVTDKSMESIIKGLEILGGAKDYVDMGEVVRCKDCFYGWDTGSFSRVDGIDKLCKWYGYGVDNNHFCSHGERKGGEDE